jgi:ABC-type bacteriocin/lantibiotic exporter with double-glycine peptidase domain
MLRRAAAILVALLWVCGLLLAVDPPGVWIDVPFVKQDKDACGAASIAMVMQYWSRQQSRPEDDSTDATRIQQELYSAEGRGIYSSDMDRYFQQHGFRTFAIRGEWGDLRLQLEKGHPLIVALKPVLGSAALHYVVVTGLDWKQNLVLVNDPAQRKLLKQDRSTFEREWSAAGKWTLLAVPLTDGR